MTWSSTMRWRLVLTLAAACAGLVRGRPSRSNRPRQQPPPKEEEPSGLSGVSRVVRAIKWRRCLPSPFRCLLRSSRISKIELPPGFKAEIWVSEILDARGSVRATRGRSSSAPTSWPGRSTPSWTRGRKAGGQDAGREADAARRHRVPQGLALRGHAQGDHALRHIEDTLDKPRDPVMVYEPAPRRHAHGWKFIKVGPDGKLYLRVGAPCNICEPSEIR